MRLYDHRLPSSTPLFPFKSQLNTFDSDNHFVTNPYGEVSWNTVIGKIQPRSKRRTDLVLASNPTSCINTKLLFEEGPQALRDRLRYILSAEAMWEITTADLLPTTRPRSKGMLSHLDDMLRYDLCDRRKGILVMNCFMVPKKTGEGRFILSGRPLNRIQSRPPPMEIPRIHDLIRQVLSWEYASQCDGTGYFYQFLRRSMSS